MRRILFLAQAEVLHIVRDRILLAQTLIVPMIQLLILSNAATFAIRNTPIQIVDLDRSTASRGVVNRLAAHGHFIVVDTTASLDRGAAARRQHRAGRRHSTRFRERADQNRIRAGGAIRQR